MGSEIREIPYVGIDFSAIHKTDFSAFPLPKRNFLSLRYQQTKCIGRVILKCSKVNKMYKEKI